MATRSAPLVFLLLAACMTTDGTRTATGDGGAPAPDSAAAAPAAPVSLPAIPRMRPKPPRKQQPARAAPVPAAKPSSAAAGGAKAAANRADPPADTATAADDTAAAAAAGVADDTAMAAGSMGPADAGAAPDPESVQQSDLAAAGAPPPGLDAAMDGADSVLLPGINSDSDSAAGTAEPDAPPAAAGDAWHPSDDDGPEDGPAFDPGADPGPELAALPLPEINPAIDVESLFDGDVVRYCAAMWQMGEDIGAARRRGEPFRQAIDDAVRRIAVEKNLPLDNRLAFSGQVYGRLVYRLEDSHAALTLGTYVHFACLTVRGDKKIVPADPNAERLLNAGLMRCENTAFTRDALNDCIFRELTPIVERRND